jgi:hypothetical protein
MRSGRAVRPTTRPTKRGWVLGLRGQISVSVLVRTRPRTHGESEWFLGRLENNSWKSDEIQAAARNSCALMNIGDTEYTIVRRRDALA